MSTEYTYKSCYASAMNDYLNYRMASNLSNGHQSLAFRDFDTFCMENQIDESELTKAAVTSWLNYHTSRGESGYWRSICIRNFARYLAATGKTPYVIPEGLYQPKAKETPFIATDDELREFFSATDNVRTDRRRPLDCYIAPIIFRLQYTCGLRPVEVRNIRVRNVNLSTGEIFIEKTKHHKQRIVTMSESMLHLCKKYDSVRKSLVKDDIWMFPSDISGILPYNGKQLNRLFEKCRRTENHEVSLKDLPHFCPYDLRHRFASAILMNWVNEGKNLNAMLPFLQAYMGHDHIRDTAYYIHLLPENLISSSNLDLKQFESIIPEVSKWPK